VILGVKVTSFLRVGIHIGLELMELHTNAHVVCWMEVLEMTIMYQQSLSWAVPEWNAGI
jgi:hypothetical protein